MTELNMILAGIVGSQAYGMATPASDTDMLGVYQASTLDILGIRNVEQSVVRKDPDWQAHELGKMFNLAIKCNPNAIDILWLPDDLYAVKTYVGRMLIEERYMFLSKAAFGSYGGYAREQFRRLQGRGNFDADKRTPEKTAKHARHLARLVIQGTELMRTAQLRVRLTRDEVGFCFDVGEEAARGEYGQIETLMDEFDAMADCSVLPDQPDLDYLNDLLVDLRLYHLNHS